MLDIGICSIGWVEMKIFSNFVFLIYLVFKVFVKVWFDSLDRLIEWGRIKIRFLKIFGSWVS